MFTGIIEDIGRVIDLRWMSDILRLKVSAGILAGCKVGDSISVNGVCLTIVEIDKNIAVFEIIRKTAKNSTLSLLKLNEQINIERSLSIDGRLNGHFVTGHIDCVGGIVQNAISGHNRFMKVKVPAKFMKFVIPKGSIAIEGVSLTIGEVDKDTFSIYLIPHTLKNTTLGFRNVGDKINIEFDILCKYVMNYFSKADKKSEINEVFLKEKGFY